MSNLRGYQRITAASKKVGGPTNLLLLTGLAGAITYKIGETTVKKLAKAVKKRKEHKPALGSGGKLYSVAIAGKSNDGLDFSVGDQFRVLESEGDSVLIEKIGDGNNPYFVSAELLRRISDYK